MENVALLASGHPDVDFLLLSHVCHQDVDGPARGHSSAIDFAMVAIVGQSQLVVVLNVKLLQNICFFAFLEPPARAFRDIGDTVAHRFAAGTLAQFEPASACVRAIHALESLAAFLDCN